MKAPQTAILFLLVPAAWVTAQCSADRPIFLCCFTYEAASQAEYILSEVCGLQVNPTEMVALGCTSDVPW